MDSILVDLSVVLVGAALLSFLAVIFKQPIIIAYILCGIIVGPWGTGWIRDSAFIQDISHIGITLLLFLAGLCLHPQKLIALFKKTTLITLTNCLVSFGIAFIFARIFGFGMVDSVIIGLALMFSSTILVVKLLPTTTLHQKRMGSVSIGILIMQDLLAVLVLMFVRCFGSVQGNLISFSLLLGKLSLFIGGLVLFEQFVLQRVMKKVEKFHEALFILGLAWCFGIASISNHMGIFYETGAFFAGVILARHKISLFISERLKPIRDFFLVLFFFSLGAGLNLFVMGRIFWQAAFVALVFIIVKPRLFKVMFVLTGEGKPFSEELGVRLGQLSEFSLLIALLAFELGHISLRASQFIQLVAIISLVVSSYVVVLKYPTPIGTTEKLIKD